MRIAMISEHASPLAAIGGVDSGGQNVHVAELARALGRRGHDVTVYTRRDRADLPGRVRAAPGVTVEHVPAGPAAELPKDELLPYMAEFGAHLAKRWAADPPAIAHAHFWMSGLAAQDGSRATGVPVVQTFHALGVVKRRHQGARDTSPASRVWLETCLAADAVLIIATCSDEVVELTRLQPAAERVAVVPCGVDLDRFTPQGPRAPRGARHRVLSLGRIVERKGVDTTIRALAQVPDAELVIAGGPPASGLSGGSTGAVTADLAADPELARLMAVAAEHAVTDRVRFIGRVSRNDVPALIRSADVVVTVPWYEPFGMVPLEAMACGVPVVATAVGGHLDTVADGRTGALVPPRDSAALAQRLRELLADPSRLAAMGSAGVGRARARYSWERIAGETELLYRLVARTTGQPAGVTSAAASTSASASASASGG